MANYLEKFNGVYNLDKRVRKIDKNYRLCFDNKTRQFYLYSIRGLNMQKELSFGTHVNAGAISKIRATRKENIAKIFKMIEKNNEKLEENAFFAKLDKSKQIVREVINYADKTSNNLSEEEINRIMNG